MSTHAHCPTICAECQSTVITLAEQTGGNPVVSLCAHQALAADQCALIIAFQREGFVTTWDVKGPMPVEHAQRLAARVAAIAPPRSELAAPS